MQLGIKWDVIFDCICMDDKHALQDIEVLTKVTNRLVVISTDSVYDPKRKQIPQNEEGYFPEHSRQKDLQEHILKGKTLSLVAGGIYLIQPIYVDDLAQVMLDCVKNTKTFNQIFCIGGPDVIENKTYYEILGELLGVPVKIKEIPLEGYVDIYPEFAGHLCHRMCDLSKLQQTGVSLPTTGIREGLKICY